MMTALDLPLVASDRKLGGMRPLKAWHHFRKLVADKEDTAQVFHIIEALKSRKSVQRAWDWIESDEGRAMMARPLDIPAMLDDHARWADCGPNTVAAHYIAFMKREGLSAHGLVEESYRWLPREARHADRTEWYFDRLRDTHDLFHILTGYGRDALGEACLLGFSYEQNRNLGVKFIAYAGTREIKRATRTRAPLFKAVREGRALGKAARMLGHMDVETIMRLDIADARRELNVGKPDVYFECLRILREEGTLESDLMAPQAAAAA